MSSQYGNLYPIKNIEPKILKEEYDVQGTEFGYDLKEDSDLVIEENTIYEIDTECMECRKK